MEHQYNRAIDVKLLADGDQALLARVAGGVFDHDIDPRYALEFLRDPRHHIAVAVEGGVVVGFASAVHYVHPDKGPEMWVNEVSVAPSHQGRGIGSAVLSALLEHCRKLGCAEAWVLADRENAPAMRLYSSLGGEQAPIDSVMFTFRFKAGADSKAHS